MIEKLKRGISAVMLALLAILPPPAFGDQDATSGGCVLQSIELDDRDPETLLRIRTDGDPASIGARVEPDQGVVLDLGCTPGSDLAGQEFASGLVSALQLNHSSAEPDGPMAVVIKIRGAFEYSVSTQPNTVLVRLRAKDDPAIPQASPEDVAPQASLDDVTPQALPDEASPAIQPSRKIRVLEPLPLPAARQPPSPPAPAVATPPTPDTSQVLAAVEDWARAWSDQRFEDYLAGYATNFQPPDGLSRPDWEARRRSRIITPDWIEVVIGDPVTYVISSDHAITSFRQSYRSNTFSDQVDKTLTLIREDGAWRIQREVSGRPAEPPPGEVGTSLQPSFLAPIVQTAPDSGKPPAEPPTPSSTPSVPTAAAIVEGARSSVIIAPGYDASYHFIPYPGGDPGLDRGSGADVVIRAYRHAGIDLQERIHEDILAAAAEYGIGTPDPHIDHRRIRNLRTFLRRHGSQLALDPEADWRPGDIVFWAVDGRLRPDHLGIVSDRRSPEGRLLVIHHEEGRTPNEEDVLFAWTVRGHFRWLPSPE